MPVPPMPARSSNGSSAFSGSKRPIVYVPEKTLPPVCNYDTACMLQDADAFPDAGSVPICVSDKGLLRFVHINQEFNHVGSF